MRPEDVTLQKSDKWKAYNYIMLFSSGNIKIGMTTDPQQRIKQLSNSNSGGFKLIDVEFSPQNYVADTVEKVLHEHFEKYRLEGEFFGNISYEEVHSFFTKVFWRKDFHNINRTRKWFCEQHNMQLSEYKSKTR